MNTTTGCEEEEPGKMGMVKVATACVDPRTVVVHLHNTPTKENGRETCSCFEYDVVVI